jgi:hypothetical protein
VLGFVILNKVHYECARFPCTSRFLGAQARTKEKVRVSPQGWRTFHFASAKLLKKIETTANRLFLVIFSSENPLFLEIG